MTARSGTDEGADLFIVDQTRERMNDEFIAAAFDFLDWFNGHGRYMKGGVPGRWMPFALTEPGIFLAL